MARKYSELREKMSPDAQARASARAQRMLREIDLAEARQLSGFTQRQLAARLGVNQPAVAKIEGREDNLLSTMHRVVEALGGALFVTAEFPTLGMFSIGNARGSSVVRFASGRVGRSLQRVGQAQGPELALGTTIPAMTRSEYLVFNPTTSPSVSCAF